jgi:hypothetical protein
MAIWMKWGENKPNRRSNRTTGDVGGTSSPQRYVDLPICYYRANSTMFGIMNDLIEIVRLPGFCFVQI